MLYIFSRNCNSKVSTFEMTYRVFKLNLKIATAIGKAYRSHQERFGKDFMPVTRSVLRLLSALNLLPISWNSTNGEFKRFRKLSLKNIVYNISFCFLCVEYFFGVFRLIQAVALNWPMTEAGGALPKIISLLAMMGTKSVIFICNLNTMLRKQEVESFINWVLRIRRAGECVSMKT